MRYLLIKINSGVYLKRNQRGELDLLYPADLKTLSVCDIQEPNKIEICRLINRDCCYAIIITEVPTNCEKVVFTQVDEKDKRFTWSAYFSIVCYMIKTQLVAIADTWDEEHKTERQYTYKLLGLIEPIVSRGLDYRSWLEDENESKPVSITNESNSK